MTGKPIRLEEIVRLCLAAGVRLSVAAGQLRVQFTGPAPQQSLLDLLRTHKAQLLALLQQDAATVSEAISRRSVEERSKVLASAAQKRMVLLAQLEAGASAYNMVGAFQLRGKLHLEALQVAMQDVMMNHEALRSRFVIEDGQVWQYLDAAAKLVWHCQDLSAQTIAQQEAALQAQLQAENHWQFDLAAGSLLRLTVLLMGDVAGQPQAVMIVNMHHIICDGWSIEIIQRQLAQAYAARCAGTAFSAPLASLQYGDYSAWSHLPAQQNRWRAQLAYWLQQLEEVPHLHSLPLDFPRSAKPGHGSGKLYRSLPNTALQKLQQQCQQYDVTLFMYLQTAFAALLSLYANESEIVVGTPVAGRRHRDLEECVGLFVNTVVLRSQIDGKLSFAELLATNKNTILQALEHQDVPFDGLLDSLELPRSRSFSPLVQIMFVLQNQATGSLQLPGLAVTKLANETEVAKFELQLVVQEHDGELQFEWLCNTELFALVSVARMADSLMRLLAVLDQQIESPLFSLPLTEPNAELALQAARPDVPLLRLEQMFDLAAGQFPQRLALADANNRLSYAELAAQATALAQRLRAAGVTRGAVVALHFERSVMMIVAMLATLKVGAAYLPLDTAHPSARLQAIFDDSGARVLCSQSAIADQLDVRGGETILLDGPQYLADAQPLLATDEVLLAQEPAYVLYTSGTTGQPKGVVVAHAGVANFLQQMDALAPLADAAHGALWSNICFDVSVYEIFSMLCRGGSLHIVPSAMRLDAETLFAWMQQRQISSSFMHAAYLVPFSQYLQRNLGQGTVSALRRMLIGVEPIAAGPVQTLMQEIPGLQVINGYGPTETTICCTLFPLGRVALAAEATLPIGRAVKNLNLRIVNPAGTPVPPGAIGELHVAGVGLALGYLNRPELNQERFICVGHGEQAQRYYRTSDFVRLNSMDELEFFGRIDTQVKVRGFRLELSEIETRLAQMPEVSDVLVIAAGDALHRQILAYVVLTEAHRGLSSAEFSQQAMPVLRRLLPEYMLPAQLIVLPQIPLNANGKPNLLQLPPPSESVARRMQAPRNEIEARLLALWQSVLELDDLSVSDDFFAIGGQSLLAMLLLAKIKEEFCLSDHAISIASLLDDPSIESFARTHARLLQEEAVRRKVQYLASLQDDVEEGVF